MKVLFSLAVAGLTVVLPASAADLFGTAPPLTYPATQGPTAVEVGSNWYIRGDVGAAFDRSPTVSVAPVSIRPLSDPTVFLPGFGGSSSTTDFTGGAGFGYRINDYLRLDATWDYHNGPARNRSGSVICPYGLTPVFNPTTLLPAGYLYDTTQTCSGFLSSKQHDNTFLGNAYVDLGTYSGFTPYVGGGLGLNINSLTQNLNFYETANGLPYTADLTSTGIAPAVWVNPFGQAIVPQPPIAFALQNWNRSLTATTYQPAWALSAGVGFHLTPSATLDVGYRYPNAGTTSTLLNPQTGLTVHQNNTSQEVRVGIRYMLQ
jgi:opacity protein-like surface antigen